jgi:cardiolipin synthase A/B
MTLSHEPLASARRGRHAFSLLPMRPFLDAVFEEMSRARRRLFVECYIVKDDTLGRALAARLLAAASRGVDVRLLYDPSGSHVTPAAAWRRLRAGGVKVRAFGRLARLGVFKPGPRNHARLVLIDGAAYTGGHAWADPWLPSEQGGGGWSDLNCRVEGPVVDDCAALFEERWRRAQRGGHRVEIDTGAAYSDLRLVSDGPGQHDLIVQAHLDAAEHARQRLWMANAYFLPMRRLERALFRAALKGVDVRIIVPATSDLPVIARAARARYAAWLRGGLQIFESRPPMMHGKYAVIDHHWCTVGSFNANASAISLAVETNLIAFEARFVATVAAEFEAQLERSCAVDMATLATRSYRTRLLDSICWFALVLLEGLLLVAALVGRGRRKLAG